MPLLTSVHSARCMNGPPAPLTEVECQSLVGQRVRLVGPGGDFTRILGWVMVNGAALDGDEIDLTLIVEAPSSGVLGVRHPARVGIGFARAEHGLKLMSVFPDPGPSVIPADEITDEQRRNGTEMNRQCAYETATSVTCRRIATAMKQLRDDAESVWHYRCITHERYPFGTAIRPIPLVPHPEEVQAPNAEWLAQTPWWRLAGGKHSDPQAVDFLGRDLFDVLADVIGKPDAIRMWVEACRISETSRAGRVDEPVTSGVVTQATVTAGVIRTHNIAPVVAKYETEVECVAHGGHCWERTGMTKPSIPPQHEEACKHCPATRLAIPRVPFYYRYPDGSVDASTGG